MNPESVEMLLKWNQKMNLAASTVVSKTLFFKDVDIVHLIVVKKLMFCLQSILEEKKS